MPTLNSILTITLLPALPPAWAKSGHVNGARVRGGITISMTWKDSELSSVDFNVDKDAKGREIEIVCKGKTLAKLTTLPGMSKNLAL